MNVSYGQYHEIAVLCYRFRPRMVISPPVARQCPAVLKLRGSHSVTTRLLKAASKG